jgi:hypothetical protein
MTQPTFIVHIQPDGAFDFHLFGEGSTRILVVDEGSPHDRVFELTARSQPELLEQILGDDAVGSRLDDRHEAVAALIVAASEGRPHLRAVEP